MASDYQLRKWRRFVKVLDQNQCQMCLSRDSDRLQAHHVWPKALYPGKALDTTNGVTLCLSCHQNVVHRGSIRDGGTREGNWTRFVTTFYTWRGRRDRAAEQKARSRLAEEVGKR